MFALRNCKFVPALTEGTSLTQGDILMDGERIVSIAPCGTAFPGCTQELDAKGATVLPGLIDMHVHLFYTRASQSETLLVDPATLTFDCLRYAQHLLRIGVTTVRDVGDDRARPATAVKNAINDGTVTGPRIIDSGMTLCPTEIGMEPFENIIEYVDSPAEMRKAVRRNFQLGAQFIKLYGSGSMMCQGSEPGVRIMEEDEICEAVHLAASKGSYTAIHAHGEEAIDTAVRCGVRTIEHASFIGEKTLQYMEGREDVGIVPTLFITKDLIDRTKSDGEMGFVVEKVKKMVENIRTSLKNAYRHNILIGWGTDVQLAAYQKDPGMEFKLRKELLEYSNLDLLKQATINSAKLLMKEQEIGTIKEGKYADLIVVAGDPVADISAMYTPPVHVIKGGVQIR